MKMKKKNSPEATIPARKEKKSRTIRQGIFCKTES